MFSRCDGLSPGSIYTGSRGHILVVFYTNSSIFASQLAESEVKGTLGHFIDTIPAQDPPTIPTAEPKCRRYPYCSRSSHCTGAFGCICAVDKWHGEFWSTSCKWPFPDVGRGLSEIDMVNATQSASSGNRTLTATDLGDIACPCNCTYVSKACCDSPTGIVHEGADLRLGSVQAPSVNATCNSITGDFQTLNTTLDVLLTGA